MLQKISNGIKGAFWGALIGVFSGLGIWVWLFQKPPFFDGDVVVISIVVCALSGYFYGERFLDWISENWLWFP